MEVAPRYAKLIIEREVTVADQTFTVAFSLAGITITDRRSLGALNEMDDETSTRAEARMIAHSVVRWNVEVGGEVVPLTEDAIYAKLSDEWIDAMLTGLFEASSWGKDETATDTSDPASSSDSTSSAPPTPHLGGGVEKKRTRDRSRRKGSASSSSPSS